MCRNSESDCRNLPYNTTEEDEEEEDEAIASVAAAAKEVSVGAAAVCLADLHGIFNVKRRPKNGDKGKSLV